jgi:LuxR family maltose regulon positive regulatory protein
MLLTFCAQMHKCAMPDTYQKLCRLIDTVLQTAAQLSFAQLQLLKGRYALIKAAGAYNDLAKMHAGCREALEILCETAGEIADSTPFTFGCPSVLFLFWRESGCLDKTLGDMDGYLQDYLKLTRGGGIGAGSVMRAEALLMRGDDDAAEIYCHKALYESRSRKQTCICICAELVLARIAILRADTEGYFTAVNNIQSYTKENPNLYVQRMADLCMAVIGLILGITDNTAKWLCDLDSIKNTLYAPAVAFAQTLYITRLVTEKRYNEFLGLSPFVLETGGSTGGVRYAMPQIYYLRLLAIVTFKTGNDGEAQEIFRQALAAALPDKIYLPFAEQSGMTDAHLLEQAKCAVSDREGIKALLTLCRRQEKGVSIIRKSVLQTKSPLTPREREIALLVRERRSAKEIAERLYISRATAKTVIRNVYSKLDIHSRGELDGVEF